MKAFLFRNLVIKEVTLAQLRQFSDFVRGPVAVAYESLVLLSFKFRIIACSELLFRPNMFENGYAVLADNQDPMSPLSAELLSQERTWHRTLGTIVKPKTHFPNRCHWDICVERRLPYGVGC